MTSLKPRAEASAEFDGPLAEALRLALATFLRGASAALAKLARRIARSRSLGPCGEPRLEFYAEAGAPEGALYLDGKLVGRIAGVRRL